MSADMEIEAVAREGLARVLDTEVDPASLDLDLDMADGYGLTSMNKVLFLMSVCDDTGVGLASFTEPDVAGMRTLRDVVTALARARRNGGLRWKTWAEIAATTLENEHVLLRAGRAPRTARRCAPSRWTRRSGVTSCS